MNELRVLLHGPGGGDDFCKRSIGFMLRHTVALELVPERLKELRVEGARLTAASMLGPESPWRKWTGAESVHFDDLLQPLFVIGTIGGGKAHKTARALPDAVWVSFVGLMTKAAISDFAGEVDRVFGRDGHCEMDVLMLLVRGLHLQHRIECSKARLDGGLWVYGVCTPGTTVDDGDAHLV